MKTMDPALGYALKVGCGTFSRRFPADVHENNDYSVLWAERIDSA
jgi:hypothetical protein